ncbi:MAG: CHAT domain-containing protein, partial [bacterium]
PFYSENISDNYASSGSEREQYSPIPSSRNEIFNIGSKFEKTHIIYDKQATEERIKRIASQYRFLHFSTHGMLDEQQPLYSGLVLFQDNDKSEDGFLQTYEIFNLNLNAELVTLSACGTGRGIMKKGEGIIGLSRAFQYAGAQSLVVSLWNVSDESTAQLMTYFYHNLKQGMNKVRALQQAKLSLMNTTKKQGDLEISYSHPFFWAPFILIGDTQQIYTSKSQYKQLYWCILMAGIIGVLIIFLKLIKQKRR